MNVLSRICVLSSLSLLVGCAATPGQQLNVYAHASHVQKGHGLAKVVVIPIDQQVVTAINSHIREYTVGSQDVLNITVWDHPELTIPAGPTRSPSDAGILVSAQGTIYYPFVGTLKVAGRTVNQIRLQLQRSLAKYIMMPQVSVRVASFMSQSIQVMGAVKTPSSMPLTNKPLSLIEAINDAGGMDPDKVNARNIFVLRGPTSAPKVYWLNANDPTALLLAEHFYLRNQDLVYVSTAKIEHIASIISFITPFVQTAYYSKTLL